MERFVCRISEPKVEHLRIVTEKTLFASLPNLESKKKSLEDDNGASDESCTLAYAEKLICDSDTGEFAGCCGCEFSQTRVKICDFPSIPQQQHVKFTGISFVSHSLLPM